MSSTLQALRGMNDILPGDTPAWLYVEDTTRAVLEGYGYAQLRLPLVESSELFTRTIGAVTDIVEKEMYTFADRNGDSLSLRPEGTAGCVRAAIEHGLCYHQIQRLWYSGAMFRHERPQAGRYRQFHQIGVETFGMAGPDIDAELIFITARLWRELGITGLELQLNSLGSLEARAAYRGELVRYLEAHHEQLDEDSKRRLISNPLRILDSKNPALQAIIVAAPQLLDHLDAAARAHFTGLCALLDAAGIAYTVNPRLVRGLDYYCNTVFEWVTTRLGAQGTVCAGGRYDGLVAQLGGKATPAAGFAMGLERLVALLPDVAQHASRATPHLYLVLAGEQAEHAGWALAETLRSALPKLRLLVNAGGGSFKTQMKRADRSGARYALLLGDDELTHDTITLKDLRADHPQQQIALLALATRVQQLLEI